METVFIHSKDIKTPDEGTEEDRIIIVENAEKNSTFVENEVLHKSVPEVPDVPEVLNIPNVPEPVPFSK